MLCVTYYGALFTYIRTHCVHVVFSFTENSSIFMAVYTIRLLMWRMMDNSWVTWPRQRIPLIPPPCQYKWQQKMLPGKWGWGWGTEPSVDVHWGKSQWNEKSLQSKLNYKQLLSIRSYWTDSNVWLGRVKLPSTEYAGPDGRLSTAA